MARGEGLGSKLGAQGGKGGGGARGLKKRKVGKKSVQLIKSLEAKWGGDEFCRKKSRRRRTIHGLYSSRVQSIRGGVGGGGGGGGGGGINDLHLSSSQGSCAKKKWGQKGRGSIRYQNKGTRRGVTL